MAWIKRNLFIVLSAVVGLVLLAGAGYFFYSNWSASNAALEEFNQAKTELENLQNKKPAPTKELIQQAKDSQKDAREILQRFKTVFASPAEVPQLDEKTFKLTLDKTIAQLQSSATNYAVSLPQPDYAFSFVGLTTKLNFPTNAIGGWLVQLSDIKGICDVIFNAKVNSLENIRRSPISADESVPGAGDFLIAGSITNDMIIRTPYEVVVRGYPREIADMMNGFMRSTNCFIIKNIDIGPSAGATSSAAVAPAAGAGDPYARNRGRRGPTATAEAVVSPQAPVNLVTEGISRVVILLEIVKPKAS